MRMSVRIRATSPSEYVHAQVGAYGSASCVFRRRFTKLPHTLSLSGRSTNAFGLVPTARTQGRSFAHAQ